MGGIASAFSGGGHRAALVGPEVVHSLVDAAEHRSLTPVASVSGACRTNGDVAQGVGAPVFAHARR